MLLIERQKGVIMINIELEVERNKYQMDLDMHKIRLEGIMKDLTLRKLYLDDLFQITDSIRKGESDYSLKTIIEKILDNLEEIEDLQNSKLSYENSIKNIEYKIENLEDDEDDYVEEI